MQLKVTKEEVLANMQDIICETRVEFGKPTTYVCVKMKNGFTVRESTTCVDPSNYDEEIGKKICLKKIEDKIWFLLGYSLQEKSYINKDSRKKIILMQGLPASGKSTWTEKYKKDHPEFASVNRDWIRKILIANQKINDSEFKWSREFEEKVIAVELDAAKTFVKNGNSLIVDDTNFSKNSIEMWEKFADEHDLELLYEFIDTPVNVCIARDSVREESVGKDVILGMYQKYLNPSKEDELKD